MPQKARKYDDDDGRVIVNMNINDIGRQDQRSRVEQSAGLAVAQGEPLNRAETLLYTWYAVLAGLCVALVFSLALVLFTLFCTQVWLR